MDTIYNYNTIYNWELGTFIEKEEDEKKKDAEKKDEDFAEK